MSSSTNTVSESSELGSKTATSIERPSSETLTVSSSPVQLERTEDLSMWLAQASPASPSALPESRPERTTSGTSGPRQPASFAWYDHDTHCWRTFQDCLLTGTLAEYSETWPRSGTVSDGQCSELTTLEHPTEGSGSGFWPTPRVSMANGPSQKEIVEGDPKGRLETAVACWPTPHGFSKDGKSNGPSGNELGRAVNRWPTPTAHDASGRGSRPKGKTGNHHLASLDYVVQHFPTPSTVDSGSYFNRSDSPGAANRPTLGAMAKYALWPTPQSFDAQGGNGGENSNRPPNQSSLQGIAGGALNPTWVEWLMGWPLEWTALEPLETDKFRQWLRLHGVS